MTSETCNGAPACLDQKQKQENTSTATTTGPVIDDRQNTNWPNVLLYIYLHLSALYGIILIFREAHWATTCLGKFIFLKIHIMNKLV
jgi:hypothetical protein